MTERMENIQNGLVNLLNAVYSSKTHNGFGFKLVHKVTKAETPIRNNEDLCEHLNTFYDWGVFKIESDVLSFVNWDTEESVILASYVDEKWIAV